MSGGAAEETSRVAVEGLLERARTELVRGSTRDSLVTIRRAWDLAREAGLPPALRKRVGDQLVASGRAADPLGQLNALRPELFSVGVRQPEFVRAFAEHVAETGDRDPEALDVLLTALEQAAPGAWRERLVRVLADGLDVDLSSHPGASRALRPLLERARRACPEATFPRYQLGRLAFLMGDLERARVELASVQGALASSPRLLNLRAHVAERTGHVAEALECHRRSLAADPHQPHVHFGIGCILLQRHVGAPGE